MTKKSLYEKLKNVKLVAMDVDGTYTDGLLFYDSQGGVIKGFHAHDGLALELLRLINVKRGFITGRIDNATTARAEYLKVDFFMNNISDKRSALKKVLGDFGFSEEECVYIGDDLNDLSAFDTSVIGIAVANADPAIKKVADYVTKTEGGKGAIREVVNMILESRNLNPVDVWKTGSGIVGPGKQ